MHRQTLIVLLVLFLWATSACRSTPTPTAPAVTRTAPTLPEQAAPTATPGTETGSVYLPLTAGETTPSPEPTAALASPSPATAVPSPTPAFPRYGGLPLDYKGIGVQIHLHREDLDTIVGHLRSLKVGWVKVQVAWKVYEPAAGRYDEERFAELDGLVERAAGEGVNVLLSVAKAPEWSRSTAEMDGPPRDPADFQRFMGALATRYRGRVEAYELWNEANLRREWNGAPLSASEVVTLIRAGAEGVRAADADAVLISGAPATTGINDGLTAVDDRVFLKEMLAAGIGDVVDGIGVHPYGWANPPGASAADATAAAPTHNDHPSFFFADTLSDYRALLDEAGYERLPLWPTEVGWGSAEGMGAPPPEGATFMAHVSERQQAVYIMEAVAMAQREEGVGPVFLWNLNFAPTFGPSFSESFYSLLRPDGTPRPVYLALQAAAGEGDE